MTNTITKTTPTLWKPYASYSSQQSGEISNQTSLKAVRAYGATIELADGSTLLDMISSWWLTPHGHGMHEIADAVAAQIKSIDQVVFADFDHEPAVELASRLSKILPEHLSGYFFSDDGSTAVEAALKMCLQYWKNLKEDSRTTFIKHSGAYHGDTFGAMAVSADSIFTRAFSLPNWNTLEIPFPDTWEGDMEIEQKEKLALDKLSMVLTEKDNVIAAMIIEPLIQGAGGMRMCRPEYLQTLQELIRPYRIPLIYDEVMTGFGRTGEWFACVKAQTKPDIICLSKCLSGGTMPLALTVATREIHDSFIFLDRSRAFFHGHSFTGNPVACAAAIASLDIFEKTGESFRRIEDMHRRLSRSLTKLSQVKHIRFSGTIMAFEIENEETSAKDGGYLHPIGPIIKQELIENGVYLRPLGNTIYLMPPYCVSEEELEKVYDALVNVIKTI